MSQDISLVETLSACLSVGPERPGTLPNRSAYQLPPIVLPSVLPQLAASSTCTNEPGKAVASRLESIQRQYLFLNSRSLVTDYCRLTAV